MKHGIRETITKVEERHVSFTVIWVLYHLYATLPLKKDADGSQI